MKKHMRLLALLAALAMVLAACGNGDADTTTTVAGAPDTTEPMTDTTEPMTDTTEPMTDTTEPMGDSDLVVGLAYDIGGRGDQSFNDSAAVGLDQAIADFGVSAEELEPAGGGENREENLQLLAEAGTDPIFAVGFAFTDGVANVAANFPDTQFAIIDSVVELDNVTSLLFAEEEGSFLAGVAAGLKTEADNIGFIGGVDIDLIHKFQAGFEAGVTAVNPDATVTVEYLTQPPDFSGFADPAKGYEAAIALFEGGADIIYHAAGGSGGGLFEAAKEVSEGMGDGQVWAIGVDSDQYLTAGADFQPYVLTSMLKRVDVAVYNTIEAAVNGTLAGGFQVFDLAADGVGLSTSGGYIDDIMSDIDDWRQQIIDGSVDVPES